MKKRIIGTLLSLSLISPAFAEVQSPEKPNVLVIMADDLGYNDLGYQGSSVVKTPHIDALAHTGVIFTDAHTAASVCSPSRAGFITGRYQQRFGHEANCPPDGLGMDTSEYTMGQAFQSLGYKTYIVGKWHLGNREDHYPTQRGFDEFWGLREGSRSFFPEKKVKQGNPRSIELNGEAVAFEGFLTDRMTDQAIRMISSDKEAPFFMFLSYTAPHTPLQATPKDLARANGNAYHALIQNMDDNIGRLMKHLEDNQLKENTIIWFLSDNGGTVHQASNKPLNGKKGIKFEGGQRVPFILNWPQGAPQGTRFDGLSSAMDIFATSFKLAGGTETPRPLDGVDLLPFVTGQVSGEPHDTLYWRKLEGKAIRSGDWKLILTEGLDPMLYNLAKDISERSNEAKNSPERVDQLRKKLEAWESEMIAPQWEEGKKWTKVRKEHYIKFRDAEDFISLR